jgi:hypothetical protein
MFYNPFNVDDNDYSEFDEFDDKENSGSSCIDDFQQTSDTVVFHPHDPTTSFLSAIYVDKGFDIVNDPFIEPDIVEKLIETHDRIICLGHGSPDGLIGGYDMIINSSLAPLLREKRLISIFCNADIFMNKHELKGFYSGMFISECQEGDLFDIPYNDESQIERSNNIFASSLGKHIDSGDSNILELVKQEYHDEDDAIITFNSNRLYFNGTEKKEG